MLENMNTCTTNSKKITINDLKKSIALIHKIEKEEKRKYDIPWFTKLMNKLGWHRKYEVLVFDSDKLKNLFTYSMRPEVK